MPATTSMRTPLLLAAMLLCAACGVAVGPVVEGARGIYTESQLDDLRHQLNSARADAVNEGRSPQERREGDRRLRELIADPRFSRLDPGERADAWRARAWAAFLLDKERQAFAHVKVALDIDPRQAWNWHALAQIEDKWGDPERAVAAAARGVELDSETIDRMESTLLDLMRWSDPGSPGTLRLLRLLRKHEWQSPDPREGQAWLRLAEEELRVGDREGARAALRLVGTPSALIRLRIDKRFDGLYNPAAPAFDFAVVVKERIRYLQSEADADPRNLELQVILGESLLESGDAGGALAIAERAKANLDAKGEAQAFDDVEDEAASLLRLQSVALRRLGKDEESHAALQAAATRPVSGEPNVNEAFDLADEHCSEGRGQQANAALDQAGKDLNQYGKVHYHYVRHCAAVLEGEVELASKHLEYIREQRKSGRSLYMRALLRENRTDEAAAELIERLLAEGSRGDALYLLQSYPRGGTSEFLHSPQVDARRLLGREDVKRAVAQVGRIEEFAYYGY